MLRGRSRGPTENLCSEAGKLIGRFVPIEMIRVPKDVIFTDEEKSSNRSLTIALQGETLWIAAVDRRACRRVLGFEVEGRLDHRRGGVCEQRRGS